MRAPQSSRRVPDARRKANAGPDIQPGIDFGALTSDWPLPHEFSGKRSQYAGKSEVQASLSADRGTISAVRAGM